MKSVSKLLLSMAVATVLMVSFQNCGKVTQTPDAYNPQNDKVHIIGDHSLIEQNDIKVGDQNENGCIDLPSDILEAGIAPLEGGHPLYDQHECCEGLRPTRTFTFMPRYQVVAIPVYLCAPADHCVPNGYRLPFPGPDACCEGLQLDASGVCTEPL